MIGRRRFCKRCLVISGAFSLLLLFLRYKSKSPETIVPEVCHDDQRQFQRDLDVALDCDCRQFKFRTSSYVDSLVNGFNTLAERHKTILYLTLLDSGRKVVLKYRKHSERALKLRQWYRVSSREEKDRILKELLSGNEFNGHPHFCSAHAFHQMTRMIQGGPDNLLVANMNFEVILLKFLKSSGLPVPDYIASCGLYLMESYGGLTMDHFYKSGVKWRLTIARNLLLAAKSLTLGHRGFRIYLTDATKDNIAVDEETLQVSFIDLDDVIIQHVDNNRNKIIIRAGEEGEETETEGSADHRHRKMDCDNCFAFSSLDICAAPKSDINIFTICQLLLEDLKGDDLRGFLYFPAELLAKYPRSWRDKWAALLTKLRRCVYCDTEHSKDDEGELDRFQLLETLVAELEFLAQ